MNCYFKLLCLKTKPLSFVLHVDILAICLYLIIDNLLGNEVVQSDTKSCINEIFARGQVKVKNTGNVGITNYAIVVSEFLVQDGFILLLTRSFVSSPQLFCMSRIP